MTANARLRISLSAGEFEVEGPETFIAQYDELARQLLGRLSSADPLTFKATDISQADNGDHALAPSLATAAQSPLPEFGEAVHHLPRNASQTDQMLLAGFYAAKKSADETFATNDASQLLIEQGIKISNPSQSLKNNISAKRVFKVGKRFKLSRDGILRVNELLGRE